MLRSPSRAAFTSLVVGTILTIINHGPSLLEGELSSGMLCQILLTFTVPYTVSTVSSVATRFELTSRQSVPPETDFCETIDPA